MEKEAVKKWVEKVGYHNACSRLVARRLSASTADRVCKGSHDSELRGANLTIVLEEMAKDGIIPKNQAS